VTGTGFDPLVARKDDLFALMVDAVMGEVDPPAPTGDWRPDLRSVAVVTRTLMLRRSWLALLSTARPNLGPNSLRWMEAVFTIIAPLGLDADEMLTIVTTLMAFVRGQVMGELAEREASRRSGFDMDQWMSAAK
jgi:hypothetical protein